MEGWLYTDILYIVWCITSCGEVKWWYYIQMNCDHSKKLVKVKFKGLELYKNTGELLPMFSQSTKHFENYELEDYSFIQYTLQNMHKDLLCVGLLGSVIHSQGFRWFTIYPYFS